jgi:hypothetical protein
MSGNKSARDKIARSINSLFSFGKAGKETGADYFYEHLAGLLKYYLATAENDEGSRLKLTEKTYSELEEFALENSGLFEYEENSETDWDLIDDAKDIFKSRLVRAFRGETDSDDFSPFVRSVSDSYENWLVYDLMHPGSVFNPWNSLLNLLKTGCLYLISDNRELLTGYVGDIYEKAGRDCRGNIAFIWGKGKKFSGFLSDSRHNSQIAAYQFLKQRASGYRHAKRSETIGRFLSESGGRHIGKRELRSAVLCPLKYTGLAGSCPKGFFRIAAPEDLRCALKFHSSEKILNIYKRRRLVLQKREEERYPLTRPPEVLKGILETV